MGRLSSKLKDNGVDEDKVTSITEGIAKYASKNFGKKAADFEPYVGESFEAEKAMYAPPFLCFQSA